MSDKAPIESASESTIECEAVPIEDAPPISSAPNIYPSIAKWALIGFLLVFALKIVGALILVVLLVSRFPRFFLTAVAAFPVLRKLSAYMNDDDERPSRKPEA